MSHNLEYQYRNKLTKWLLKRCSKKDIEEILDKHSLNVLNYNNIGIFYNYLDYFRLVYARYMEPTYRAKTLLGV